MKTILSLLFFLCLSGCSHVSQMASAEKHESAALVKSDKSKKAVMARVATYNRELAYALSLPPTPKTQAASTHLLTLQYALTGPAPDAQTKMDAFVDEIVKDDQTARDALRQAALDDLKLKDQMQAATDARDQAVLKVNTMALMNAGQADKLGHLWTIIYVLVGLGFAALTLRVLYAFGVFGATVAAKVP